MDFPRFSALLASGRVFRKQSGRYWIAVSLAEAETLRRLIHVQQASNKPLIANSDAAIALRYSPASSIPDVPGGGAAVLEGSRAATPKAGGGGGGRAKDNKEVTRASGNKMLNAFCGILFDGSQRWHEVFFHEDAPPGSSSSSLVSAAQLQQRQQLGHPDYQRAVVHACMRFFDNDAHFSKPAVNTLIQTLERTPPHLREKFFVGTIGCRRRMAIKPGSGSALRPVREDAGLRWVCLALHVCFLCLSFCRQDCVAPWLPPFAAHHICHN